MTDVGNATAQTSAVETSSTATAMNVTRADVCVIACAEAFRGNGAIVASPMSTVARLGALVARWTFEPDLLISDGEAQLLAEPVPLGSEPNAPKEGWLPFRDVFHVVNSGRRHVIMGATQIDRFGNQNISALGDWRQPKVQLLGARGAPGNTANHATSYWVNAHSTRVFVDKVDFASGVGTDRAAQAREVARHHHLPFVITDLAVLDLHGPGATMRLLSVHPGVAIDDVIRATGFPLALPDDDPAKVTTSREPSPTELAIINHLDPKGLRFHEVPRPEATT